MQNVYAGQLRLKAGWYLDTTVELKGLKQKVGVYDGDCNLRLGDVAKAQTYRSSGEEENWYFGPGDFLLMDVDGSGAFESDAFDSESCSLWPHALFWREPLQGGADRGLQVPASGAVAGGSGRSGPAAAWRPGAQCHAGLGTGRRAMAARPRGRGRWQNQSAAGELPVISLASCWEKARRVTR